MKTLYLEMNISIYNCQSLKQKRNIANGIADKLKKKYNVSVAQKHFSSNLNEFILGIAAVSINFQQLDKLRQRIITYVDNNVHEAEIIQISHEIY